MRRLLEIKRPPHIIAFSAAVGTFIGFSPYLGLHTVLAIAISYIFDLPIYPVILAAYITNPFTFIFIYAFCFKVGLILTDIQVKITVDWNHLTFKELFNNVKDVLVPFFVGTHVVGVVASVVIYFAVYYMVKRYRRENG